MSTATIPIDPVVQRDQDGRTAIVVQLATNTMMYVFKPRVSLQFRRGFERDQWYFAPLADSMIRPRSNPYPSMDAAIAAVNVPTAD